jgi:hypothetical protein
MSKTTPVKPRRPRRKLVVNPGDRIGRGVVIEEIRVPHSQAASQRGARMQCDCGTVYEVSLGNLLAEDGPTLSCGCFLADAARERAKSKPAGAAGPRYIHGLSHTHPLYQTWQNMMRRCYDPRKKEYRWYGARGIQVCERWHNPVFFTQDIDRLLGPRPEGGSIDRYPDKNGDYEEGNVRWADQGEQARNSRNYMDGRAAKRLYYTWHSMLRDHPDEVCERWRDFPAFEKDVEPTAPGTLGMCFIRINTQQPYSSGNVKWITRAEFQTWAVEERWRWSG